MGDMSPLYWRPGQNSAITIAGARPNSNVYLLDGTVNTDPSFNTFVISLPPDSIREFQIQTGTYTAELGAGTGQINVVTKSGTFKLQGIALRIRPEQQVRLAGVHESRRAAAVLAESVRRHARAVRWDAGFFFFGGYEGLRTHAAHVEHHVRAGFGRTRSVISAAARPFTIR